MSLTIIATAAIATTTSVESTEREKHIQLKIADLLKKKEEAEIETEAKDHIYAGSTARLPHDLTKLNVIRLELAAKGIVYNLRAWTICTKLIARSMHTPTHVAAWNCWRYWSEEVHNAYKDESVMIKNVGQIYGYAYSASDTLQAITHTLDIKFSIPITRKELYNKIARKYPLMMLKGEKIDPLTLRDIR